MPSYILFVTITDGKLMSRGGCRRPALARSPPRFCHRFYFFTLRGPLSQWLYAGLTQAGFDAVLLETRHVKAALSAMVVKTDRKDARGIAQLIRMGWFRAVHAKSASSQEIRALLTSRRLLLDKLRDVELSLRGILRGFVTEARQGDAEGL